MFVTVLLLRFLVLLLRFLLLGSILIAMINWTMFRTSDSLNKINKTNVSSPSHHLWCSNFLSEASANGSGYQSNKFRRENVYINPPVCLKEKELTDSLSVCSHSRKTTNGNKCFLNTLRAKNTEEKYTWKKKKMSWFFLLSCLEF